MAQGQAEQNIRQNTAGQDHPANRIGKLMPREYQAIVEEQKVEFEATNVA